MTGDWILPSVNISGILSGRPRSINGNSAPTHMAMTVMDSAILVTGLRHSA